MNTLPVEAVNYLVIGHVSKDVTPAGHALGGTAAYAGLTAHALGMRVGVVTSAGPDLDLTPLDELLVHCLPAEESTAFENIYLRGTRRQRLLGLALPLGPASVPLAWRSAPIVHLGPIAREVASQMIDLFPTALLGITPQGWMRTWDQQGRIARGPWENEEELLATAGAVVISIEDIEGDQVYKQALAQRCRLLVVTQASQGAEVFWQGRQRRFPAPRLNEVDPTGSGDIFAAAFFVHLFQTKDPWEAASFANSLAAASVARRGIASIPMREDVQSALEQAST